jgi:carboxyl-terminal processing protease
MEDLPAGGHAAEDGVRFRRVSGTGPASRGAAPLRRSLAAAVLLPVVVGGFALHSWTGRDAERVFHEVVAHLAGHGLDSVPRDLLYEQAARGLLAEIGDPYAELFSPEQLAEFSRQTLRNSYAGIGMQISLVRDTATVIRVFGGSPAAAGGVRTGDRIVRAAGEAVTGIPLDQVTARLLGPPGTVVEVTFRRGGESVERVFTRRRVRYPAVPYALMLESGIGYLALEGFNDTSADEVAASLRDLRERGATSFVLDLRGNTGGSVDQAIRIAGLFLPGGTPVLRAAFRDAPAASYAAEGTPFLPAAPLVVLTDEESASAAEIVAGALQDHDRAVLVGVTTFGKGVVQDIFSLDGGWALKLTTGRWFTPAGRTIERERRGVRRGADPAPEPADRPVFRSAGGRPLVGGGGITPDLVVAADTLVGAELELMRVLAARAGTVNQVMQEVALDLHGGVGPSFSSGPAWRAELRAALERRGIRVDAERWAAGATLIDRLMEARVTELAFGDSAAFRRGIDRDVQLRAGLRVLRGASTQDEALRRTTRAVSAGRG